MATVDLQRDILDRSHEIPVVVDFWASWCAPCRTLGPVLDALAAESDGRWELVKLSTEEQPEIAQMFDVRGIPAVKMFREGQIVGEFVGALPRSEVERWLASYLPDPRAEKLAALLVEHRDSPRDQRLHAIERLLAEHPDWLTGRIHAARAMVFDDPRQARAIAAEVEVDAEQAELAADVVALADLLELAGDPPPRVAPHLEGAREALRREDAEAALEHLIEAAMRDRHFGDDLARRVAVALFHQWGQDDERTRRYQRRLAMALHS